MDYRFILRFIPAILEGVQVTVALAVLTIVICVVWGLLVALAGDSRSLLLRSAARAYTQLIRNTPLLIQIYLIYFGLAMAGYGLSGFNSGLLALCIHNGAYFGEIYRGGLQSINVKQYEAGRALGMRNWTLYTNVILPQMYPRVMPSLTNQAVISIKDTSLVAAISVMDIMKITQLWVEASAAAYEVFSVVMVVYVVLTSIAIVVGRVVERSIKFVE